MAMPIAPWKIGKTQQLTATASSAQSSAFGSQTRALMLSCITANVHIAIGPNPTATATSFLIPAGTTPIVVGCAPGDKIAIIQDTSGGVLYVAELDH